MNIICVICSELFMSGADVYFTQCGHTFHYHCLISWLERSKTCPQCRNRVTEKTIHKVYFNVPTNEPTVDATTLMYKLDNANFTLTLKDKEIKNINEKKTKLKEQNKALRQEIQKLESNEKCMESTLHAFKDQITYFKSKAKESDRLSDEIVKLRNTVKNIENVNAVIHGTREQVNDILRDQNNAESLALLAATLKKALLDSEKKSRDTDYNLKKIKNELNKCKKENTSLEAQNADLRRELQQIKFKNEKEKEILKQRLKDANKNNIVLTNPDVDTSHNESLLEQNVTLNTSLSVSERLEDIVNSDSPYLPVKSNFSYFLNTKVQAPSTKAYSMYKSKAKVADAKTKSDDIVYDGLGGSQKMDIFPTAKPKKVGLKRIKSSGVISSSKFRKLAPTNTKNKLTEIVLLND